MALIRILVLARLLGPREVGLVAVAVVSLSLLDAATVTATQLSLIRQKQHRHLPNAAWSIGLVRGVLIGALLVLGSGLIGRWLAEPDVVPLLRAMAVLPMFAGFRNVAIVEFDKDLRFGPYYRLELAATLADLPLALVFANAWALVGGYYALTLTRVGVSYFVHPCRPRWAWNRADARTLLRFAPALIVLTPGRRDDRCYRRAARRRAARPVPRRLAYRGAAGSGCGASAGGRYDPSLRPTGGRARPRAAGLLEEPRCRGCRRSCRGGA